MLETKLVSINELDNEVQVSFEADGKSFQEKYEKVSDLGRKSAEHRRSRP